MAQGISVAFLFGRRIHGVGILIDGKVMYGANGAEGELEDIPVQNKDRKTLDFMLIISARSLHCLTRKELFFMRVTMT